MLFHDIYVIPLPNASQLQEQANQIRSRIVSIISSTINIHF